MARGTGSIVRKPRISWRRQTSDDRNLDRSTSSRSTVRTASVHGGTGTPRGSAGGNSGSGPQDGGGSGDGGTNEGRAENGLSRAALEVAALADDRGTRDEGYMLRRIKAMGPSDLYDLFLFAEAWNKWNQSQRKSLVFSGQRGMNNNGGSPAGMVDARPVMMEGEEVELDHPDDPLLVLAPSGDTGDEGDDDDEDLSSVSSAALRPGLAREGSLKMLGRLARDGSFKLRRKVSYLSSPLPEGRRSGVPLVRVVGTSRRDINGRYGYVHAYYRTRERYAVILLGNDEEGEGAPHPALVYFGAADAMARRHGGNTLFLPPSAVTRLGPLDAVSLTFQYVSLRFLKMPSLAGAAGGAMDCLRDRVLPPLRLENFSIFALLILPIALSKLGQFLSDKWEELGLWQWGAASTAKAVLSHPMEFFLEHRGDIGMVLCLLVGTSAIAKFILSEYRFVREKAEAIVLHQEGDEPDLDSSGRGPVGAKKAFSKLEMFEYRIDYHFSTSKWAKVVLLLSFTFILVAVGAGLLAAFMDDHSISNAVWIAWTYVADPGTHADCPETLLIRLISFAVTLGGMLIFALMIGIISDYIAEKVDDLKKGKSRIIDIDHTVMLGWNDKSLAIIQQVALANESEGGGTIVVLANDDKEELEETLAMAVESNENPLRLLGTEVIFRSGNPLLESELRRVSIQTARSVVSLSAEDMDPDESDATQVRQVMALKAFDEFNGSKCHVVVEVLDVDNEELFPLVAPDFAEVVVTHDIIGRLMIQCARCPGLASVLEAMMGFDGSEFYFEEWPELAGQTFYDITCRFNDAIPIGVKAASDGQVYINPENDHIINEGDKILVLAEDNDSYEVNEADYPIDNVGRIPPNSGYVKKVERIMFCGWRRDLADMIKQLDEYVEKGSELWLLNLVPARERASLLKDKGNKADLRLENLTICNVIGNPVIRRDLNNIRAVDIDGKETGHEITLDQFDSILILADAVAIDNGANMMSSDSRSLSSLLIIQDIQKKLYEERLRRYAFARIPCSPISEILDCRTKSLLSVAKCKGYIMSNQIISSVIAQVSEEKDINTVLREILTAEGSETYIRLVSRYIDLKRERAMSFWDIALRARQLREVAVGYKPESMDYEEAEELIINPPDKMVKRKWNQGDVIITFALD